MTRSSVTGCYCRPNLIKIRRLGDKDGQILVILLVKPVFEIFERDFFVILRWQRVSSVCK
jgi:hypothetical protein